MNSFEAWSEKLDKSISSMQALFKNQFENRYQSPEVKRMNDIEQQLLQLMAWEDDMTVKKAIEMMCIPNSTLTSVINRLEASGILKREIHSQDKRTYILRLTENGEEIIRIKKFEKQQFFYYMLQGLDREEERTQLVRLLEKIAASIHDSDKNLKRRIHMNAIEREYDRFGPWLTEITGEEEVPHQFAALKDQILDGLYAFKIPVDIERREAKVGMLLYDHVVTLTDSTVKVFKYGEDGIDIQEIPVKDIRYVQYIVNLLCGELVLGTASEVITINFNPVSVKVIEETVEMLRQRYASGSTRVDLDSIQEHIVIESHLYQTLLAYEKGKENVKLIEYQPFMELEKGKVTNIRQHKDAFDEPVLQESLFMTNGRELMVLSRVKEVKDEKDVDFGYKYTYMPMENIRDISLEDDAALAHLKDLKFMIEDAPLIFKVGNAFSVEILKRLLKI